MCHELIFYIVVRIFLCTDLPVCLHVNIIKQKMFLDHAEHYTIRC